MATVGSVGSFNFTGLSTGIDTDKIIAGLTQINQRRIDTLTARQNDVVDKQTTFALLQGKLFDLQTKTGALARSAGGAFDARKASSSDDTALTAAAGTAATPGTYTVTVAALAQAHQTASAGFTDPNARLKEGTLAVQVGSGTATTITVDSRNNTLQGLADSINAAGAGVRAAVINDGSAAPYRLLLTANATGAANTIAVTNDLTAGTGADIDPTASTVQAAADAQVKIGSGAGALTVASAGNQVTNLIPGVSLNLLRADPAKPITLSVANDTAGAATAVKDLVATYNEFAAFVSDLTRFDAQTQKGGKLLGNRDVAALQNDLATAVTAAVPGLAAGANRLAAVGLSLGDGGKLNLDEDKLNAALSGQSGASVGDVKRLFGITGASDDPSVAFGIATSKTKPSGAVAYEAHVTGPATRAVVTASSPTAPVIVISPPNNALMLKLNTLITAGVTLTAGTYAPEALVAMPQQQINTSPAVGGSAVSVGLDGSGRIQIASQLYGSGSQVGFAGGAVLADLGFTGTESATGTDVAGHFVVGGRTEAATGAGQVLTGKAGNANTDGLQVRATGTAPGTANVTVTQGLASRLGAVIDKYLDPTAGRFKTITDGLKDQFDDFGRTIVKQNDTLAAKTDALTRRFAAMEAAVSSLKGLQSQLASLIPPSTK